MVCFFATTTKSQRTHVSNSVSTVGPRPWLWSQYKGSGFFNLGLGPLISFVYVFSSLPLSPWIVGCPVEFMCAPAEQIKHNSVRVLLRARSNTIIYPTGSTRKRLACSCLQNSYPPRSTCALSQFLSILLLHTDLGSSCPNLACCWAHSCISVSHIRLAMLANGYIVTRKQVAQRVCVCSI